MPFLLVTTYQLKYSNCLLRPDITDPNELQRTDFVKYVKYVVVKVNYFLMKMAEC